MDDAPIREVMATQRAVRRYRRDPIPHAVIRDVIRQATYAPSGGNRQPWEFVVVTDASIRRRLGDIYRQASEDEFMERATAAETELARRIYRDALHLSRHLAEAPVLVLVCVRVSTGRTASAEAASIYPAVQNLLLTARAHGLGSVLTTVHKRRDADVKALLRIPSDVETACLVPLGYPVDPDQAFRPITGRRSVDEVLHWEHFDADPSPG